MSDLPKKDQVIYCSVCDKDLFRFKRDIVNGDIPGPEVLEVMPGQAQPILNETMVCSHCKSLVNPFMYRWPKHVITESQAYGNDCPHGKCDV